MTLKFAPWAEILPIKVEDHVLGQDVWLQFTVHLPL